MRVLIVEDETAAYENLVDILGEVSYDIQIAAQLQISVAFFCSIGLYFLV